MSATTASDASKFQHRLVWGIRLLLALTFAAAGTAKLLGVPQMIQIFEAIGAGQWFRYATGIVEVVGALLLLVPSMGFWGSFLLAVTMAFGVAIHLFVMGGNPVPALVLGLLSAFVAWRLRPGPIPAAS